MKLCQLNPAIGKFGVCAYLPDTVSRRLAYPHCRQSRFGEISNTAGHWIWEKKCL